MGKAKNFFLTFRTFGNTGIKGEFLIQYLEYWEALK